MKEPGSQACMRKEKKNKHTQRTPKNRSKYLCLVTTVRHEPSQRHYMTSGPLIKDKAKTCTTSEGGSGIRTGSKAVDGQTRQAVTPPLCYTNIMSIQRKDEQKGSEITLCLWQLNL